jgi:hypothetical protein
MRSPVGPGNSRLQRPHGASEKILTDEADDLVITRSASGMGIRGVYVDAPGSDD